VGDGKNKGVLIESYRYQHKDCISKTTAFATAVSMSAMWFVAGYMLGM